MSVLWPMAALLPVAGAPGTPGLSLALGAGALLLAALVAVRWVRPVAPASLLASDVEPFASVRGRIRVSDLGAQGHVRSRAPGGGV